MGIFAADGDDFNTIDDDKIDNQTGWDDDVENYIRKLDCGEDDDEKVDVIVEADLEGESIFDDILIWKNAFWISNIS